MSRHAESGRAIVVLQGGLGNQLFIYAFARALARSGAQRVWLDVTSCYPVNERFGRKPLVHYFNHSGLEVLPVTGLTARARWAFVRMGKRGILPFSIYALEKEQRFDERFLRPFGAPIRFYDGYFQSLGYVTMMREALRREWRGVCADSPRDHGLQGERPVAVHVRQKDLAIKLPRSYYSAAISAIEREVADPDYWLFTDAPAEALELLPRGKRISIASGMFADEWAELQAMASFPRIVIANSTFSWWAAWLANAETQVYAPPLAAFDQRRTEMLPCEWKTMVIS